jgi:hypothetical protein
MARRKTHIDSGSVSSSLVDLFVRLVDMVVWGDGTVNQTLIKVLV